MLSIEKRHGSATQQVFVTFLVLVHFDLASARFACQLDLPALAFHHHAAFAFGDNQRIDDLVHVVHRLAVDRNDPVAVLESELAARFVEGVSPARIYIGICYTWGDNYFSNEDARWGYTFNEAGRKLGFQDGDRIVSIDGEAVDNVNKIVNALIITEGERRVVVEREGRQVELTLPLGELIEMRQNKGYEDLLALRMPFLIDSAGGTGKTAVGAQGAGDGDRGDKNDAQGLEYPAYKGNRT